MNRKSTVFTVPPSFFFTFSLTSFSPIVPPSFSFFLFFSVYFILVPGKQRFLLESNTVKLRIWNLLTTFCKIVG